MPSHFRAFLMKVEMHVSKRIFNCTKTCINRWRYSRRIADTQTYRIILLSARLTMSSKLASNTFSPPFWSIRFTYRMTICIFTCTTPLAYLNGHPFLILGVHKEQFARQYVSWIHEVDHPQWIQLALVCILCWDVGSKWREYFPWWGQTKQPIGCKWPVVQFRHNWRHFRQHRHHE